MTVVELPRSARRLAASVDALRSPPRIGNPGPRRGPSTADRLRWLADYLRQRIDPHDFPERLRDFFDYEGEAPASFDGRDPYSFFSSPEWPAFSEAFSAWLLEHAIDGELMSDPHSPAYLHFSGVRLLPEGTWLVHFSDDAGDISRRGFVYGHADERTLALTTLLADDVRFDEAGWNFAFEAASADALRAAAENKYGSSAVLFRAAAVSAVHASDGERQAIFWGPSVKRAALLSGEGGRSWRVDDLRTGDVAFRGPFREAVAWAEDHFEERSPRVSAAFAARPRR